METNNPQNNQPRPEAVVLGRPPEGADYVRLPPLGAWSWSGPGFLPGTSRGFSVDDDFQAYPLSCESLPKPSPEWEKHAGSLEALRVTRPKAVVLAGNKLWVRHTRRHSPRILANPRSRNRRKP